jgi:predicted thioesterase
LVNVQHLSATPLGMKVWCDSKLIKIVNRKLTFEVNAYDDEGIIGKGIHERFIIDVKKFLDRVDLKRK